MVCGSLPSSFFHSAQNLRVSASRFLEVGVLSSLSNGSRAGRPCLLRSWFLMKWAKECFWKCCSTHSRRTVNLPLLAMAMSSGESSMISSGTPASSKSLYAQSSGIRSMTLGAVARLKSSMAWSLLLPQYCSLPVWGME